MWALEGGEGVTVAALPAEPNGAERGAEAARSSGRLLARERERTAKWSRRRQPGSRHASRRECSEADARARYSPHRIESSLVVPAEVARRLVHM